jgi:hypothetical protein
LSSYEITTNPIAIGLITNVTKGIISASPRLERRDQWPPARSLQPVVNPTLDCSSKSMPEDVCRGISAAAVHVNEFDRHWSCNMFRLDREWSCNMYRLDRDFLLQLYIYSRVIYHCIVCDAYHHPQYCISYSKTWISEMFHISETALNQVP